MPCPDSVKSILGELERASLPAVPRPSASSPYSADEIETFSLRTGGGGVGASYSWVPGAPPEGWDVLDRLADAIINAVFREC